jgi:hypothetical protein
MLNCANVNKKYIKNMNGNLSFRKMTFRQGGLFQVLSSREMRKKPLSYNNQPLPGD